MKEHELVAAIRETGRIDTHEHAERAIKATLEVLGERLAGGQSRDLASQLPPALASALPDQGEGQVFGLEEFYQRVADHEGTEPRQARQHARAVLAAIKVSVNPGLFEHVAAQLPADYDDLLSTQPVQH
ncbi:DUF2267 domain-containing protein [Actinomadura bangladeshensis]|jgi:uncharacterized protein (DUF2267 family)|uniref:DUF2267 domain-containing protein n=1 Tax=Actinomadura bangladeshensis TaxID=453573 RepID=A0A6L9QTD9_9ACTN|nr:DUF2267 domain-containing protein [Actinomadura bangladeshensis]NEA28755.1 DUF2267 domain-containing protein [Actinomadura bangladeshensis]